MGESQLYDPIRRLLQSKGYRAVVTHRRGNKVRIPVGDIFPAKAWIEPDVVGLRRSLSETICVEAKAKLTERTLFELTGKCTIWRQVAGQVYAAIPHQKGLRREGFRSLGLGVIVVEGDEARELDPAPQNENLDTTRTDLLYKSARQEIISEQPFLEILSQNVEKLKDGWKITIDMKNVGSHQLEVQDILINEMSHHDFGVLIHDVSHLVEELEDLRHQTYVLDEEEQLFRQKYQFRVKPDAQYKVGFVLPRGRFATGDKIDLKVVESDFVEHLDKMTLP